MIHGRVPRWPDPPPAGRPEVLAAWKKADEARGEASFRLNELRHRNKRCTNRELVELVLKLRAANDAMFRAFEEARRLTMG